MAKSKTPKDKEPKVAKPKLDMFEVLKNIDKGSIDYYSSLDADLKKGFVPLLTMRWLSGGKGNNIDYINRLLNTMVFPLYQHPDLLYKLSTICSNGKYKSYQYPKRAKRDSNKEEILLIKQYYACSEREAYEYLPMLTEEDIEDIRNAIGA